MGNQCDLPAGLNFGTSNGTIWGIPTVLQTTATTYTIWANNSGGSTSAIITITINDEAPGPFEYIPENNTWTNNSYVNIGPSFINQTSGNGSTWQVTNINSGSANSHAGQQMNLLVGDTLYFSADDGSTGTELWAHNTSNGTTWSCRHLHWFRKQQPRTAHSTACRTTSSTSQPLTGAPVRNCGRTTPPTKRHGRWPISSAVRVMGTLDGACLPTLLETPSFDANTGGPTSDRELWAHNTSNGTTWRGPTSTVVEEAAILAIHEYRRWRYPLF